MKLLVGPPASGKTTRLLERAQETLSRRGRVWWVGLPHQRAYVYRRATQRGGVMGLEVMSFQRVYYRLLTSNAGLRPILTGPGRVALVGEALRELDDRLPSPGEARLFARAVAEAKRFGVRPQEIPARGPEARRLVRVYRRYEELKEVWGRWDYDDFRLEALRLVESGEYRLEDGLALLVVDGFRELTPVEIRFLNALARRIQVWAALPNLEASPIPPPCDPQVQTYRAPNPVSEARWVLRSIKRDLAQGMSPLDLAVVAPESRQAALLTLADEYGVPLVEQTPKTAADTPEGRLLLSLLELPDHPTPSKLLSIPELAPLGRAALERGLAGREAVGRLAAEMGLADFWQSWIDRLEPGPDPERWARGLLDSLPQIQGPRRELLLERAKEAGRIANGPDFRPWWAALVAETYEPAQRPGGVALLTPTLASGIRYKRLYLTYAVEGAYRVGEREDYFIPEEDRIALEALLGQVGLPRRFQGRDRLLLAELRSRAEEVTITYPEADQERQNLPEPALVRGRAPGLPEVPPGSALEVGEGVPYRAKLSTLTLGTATVEGLRRYEACPFRFWIERRLGIREERPWWQELVRELRGVQRLNEARFETLKARYAEGAGWLERFQEPLFSLTFGLVLPTQGEPQARIDAALNRGGEVSLYTFTEPGRMEPKEFLRGRWSELWLAGYLLERNPRQVRAVRILVWPVLGEPMEAYEAPITREGGAVKRQIEHRALKVQEAWERFRRGEVSPRPGFQCRECGVRDVCREGRIG